MASAPYQNDNFFATMTVKTDSQKKQVCYFGRRYILCLQFNTLHMHGRLQDSEVGRAEEENGAQSVPTILATPTFKMAACAYFIKS